ncbi:hypothetical protein MUK42_02523 [Musa troglodytarum]|uniref:Uncharacterized protein n=1 Tax=Musa troglodytarum TaxID=320322 RepID=A0A9E7L9P0_9LILI|nr:hypothetical protein MUK42_02523 [Musa troglodytarum]
MKLRVVYRKLYDHVLYELLFFSLPYPLHIKKQRKLTWRERWYVLKEV